ncbi:MAG: hypothetical protein ABIW76_11750 [Fibrobacteria bacterium]
MRVHPVELPLPAQTGFYRSFRDKVKGDLSLPSKLVRYARIMGLVAGNWRIIKKAFFT